jgi:hypothetical protein
MPLDISNGYLYSAFTPCHVGPLDTFDGILPPSTSLSLYLYLLSIPPLALY